MHQKIILNQFYRIYIFLLICLVLGFRLYFSLFKDIWSDDERQIYLSGVKFFTSKKLPALGPDVVHTGEQIAGSLQAFLVGIPFFAMDHPFSPVLLLNILSLLGLSLLLWWLKFWLKNTSAVVMGIFLATLPWTLHISTHIYNPSYLLFPSCVFFVAFFESIPSLSTRRLSPAVKVFFLSFAVFFCMQIHLSWVLLIPFYLIAVLWNLKKIRVRTFLFSTGLGASIPGIFLIPAINQFGLSATFKPLLSNSSALNFANLLNPFELLARFISLGCYELTRFLGDRGDERLYFLLHHPLITLPAFLLVAVGIFQVGWFILQVYNYGQSRKKFERDLTRLFIGCFLITWAAFWFSTRPPTTRNYYILAPVVFSLLIIYLDRWAVSDRRKIAFTALVFIHIFYQAGSIFYAQTPDSFLARKEILSHSLHTQNYLLIGERRYDLK